MGTDLDLTQRAVFSIITMIFAGINGTFYTVISVAFVHICLNLLFDFVFDIIMPQ